MGIKETNIVTESQLTLSPLGVVLWKNVRGVFRQLRSEARIRAGLGPNGASDGIGYQKIIITQAMVGLPMARFCAIEFKTADGEERQHQQRFIDRVNADGGVAGFARSAEDAKRLFPK